MDNIRKLKGESKIVRVKDLLIGEGQRPIIIAGPCAVESEEQMKKTATAISKSGVDMLRGGVFKPRTSPFDFQGLGVEGLPHLKSAADAIGVPVVTELMDEKHLEIVSEYADVIQIGARNMHNYPLLKAVGNQSKPVLLKRGISATIREWMMAAEYIAQNGNSDIILCERGIRSFDLYTRNVLDLAAVPIMKKETGLPVIVDPSHGTGLRDLIIPMTRAAIACGADGVIIEVHHNPDEALCDGLQSLPPEMYSELRDEMRKLEKMFG